MDMFATQLIPYLTRPYLFKRICVYIFNIYLCFYFPLVQFQFLWASSCFFHQYYKNFLLLLQSREHSGWIWCVLCVCACHYYHQTATTTIALIWESKKTSFFPVTVLRFTYILKKCSIRSCIFIYLLYTIKMCFAKSKRKEMAEQKNRKPFV